MARTAEEEWQRILVDGRHALNGARRVFGRLPSNPRCKMCQNPFGGFGGRVFRIVGHSRSRMNPNLCSACCEGMPIGGIEIDIAVLFADVRGSTGLGERSDPAAFAALMNRFYEASARVLVAHDALVDKLIGDEVMALFIPGIAGPDYRTRAVEAGAALLTAVGHGTADGPWLDLGVGVNAGVAYVGNVGSEAVTDFTALGDPVNVAARLQAEAAPGQMVVSADVLGDADPVVPIAERRTVTVRGREEPLSVVVHVP